MGTLPTVQLIERCLWYDRRVEESKGKSKQVAGSPLGLGLFHVSLTEIISFIPAV